MDLQEQLERDGIALTDALHGEDHRIDVPKHLVGGDICRRLVCCTDDLSVEQSSRANLKALDPGRGHRLCSKEQAGKGFSINQSPGLCIQPSNGRLRVGDISRDGAVERDPSLEKGVGKVRFVVARPAVLTG
jgi:hypothetical protein